MHSYRMMFGIDLERWMALSGYLFFLKKVVYSIVNKEKKSIA